MTGLALSGGGFRATLFHVGALWRFNELGMLQGMNEITSVSGGSIIAAYLGLEWKNLRFGTNGVAGNFNEIIVNPVTSFCARTIDVGTILGGIINPVKHPSELLIKRYRKYLFSDATLQDLPDPNGNPRFTIYATSMQSGASVRFCREFLGEYHLGKIEFPDLKLAVAVAASSAFPPPLCPVCVNLDAKAWQESDISDLHDDDYLKSTMRLVDGGVYDNLGLTHLFHHCDTIFVSDAGAPFSIQRKMILTRYSQIARTKRTLDIMSGQIRALRTSDLVGRYKSGSLKGAYWGIGTNIDDYPLVKNNLPPALTKDSDTTREIAQIRTRLDKFKPKEQGQLINWGYSLTDAALRSHYNSNLPPATNFPMANYPI
ncbi:patatin-like phospholipase family protein [candidate division KSB1 bacterium]|nr:patatin-like phospholipase family protein [candidate division KSB1 bacterium]